MTVKIVTDSNCDLPAELVSRYGITVVPMYINVGKKSYLDGVELTHEQFYEGLPHFDHHPTTSVPGPGQLVQEYERLADAGATAILSIHIGSALSAMVGIARLAAQETEKVPVTVFDSGQLTLGTGLLVLTAARAAAEGRPLSDIVAALEDQASRTHCIAALDTLEYLRRSGRLSRFQSSLGSVLQIKPVLKMHSGEFEMERVRTRNGAFSRVIELLTQLAPFEKLALVHTHALQKAHLLHQQVSHLFPGGEEPLYAEVTPVIGTHIGPGAAGFVAVQAKKGV
ncbi:MAG TPA: DegV family protein [Anaerolineae bacterium]|nr:DegV family protein [Anaerolineae bacterium]